MIQKRFLELPPSQQRCLQPFLFASHIFNMNRAHTHTRSIGNRTCSLPDHLRLTHWKYDFPHFPPKPLSSLRNTKIHTWYYTVSLFKLFLQQPRAWMVFLQFSLHSGVQVHEQRNVYIGAPRWTHGKVQRFPCPILSPGAPCRRELNTASPRRRKIARKTCPLNSRQVQVLFEVQSSSLLCIFFAETSQRLALEKLMLV